MFKIIRYSSLFILCIMIFESRAQEKKDKINTNTIFIEISGTSASVYHITYDKIFFQYKKNKISAALGFQYLGPKTERRSRRANLITPHINYNYGSKHNLEIGIGLSYRLHYEGWLIPFRFGYRFQPFEKHFFFKFAYTPFWASKYSSSGKGFRYFNFGLALGITF